MKKPSFRERFLYFFDSSLSRGSIGLIGWLLIFSGLTIFLITSLVWFGKVAPAKTGGQSYTFGELLWMSLMRTLDPGTMGGDEGSWIFLFLMLAVTLVGIIMISALIGIISNSILEKIESLRKGRSIVIEQGHTVILGWTAEIFTIISELVITNENKEKPRIVILADKDKVEMEERIRERIPDTKNTRIICRTGSPIEYHDLEIANIYEAHSIIILSPDEENPDSEVIKTLLAIINDPKRRKSPYHIVAVVKDPSNLEVAKMVGKDEVELLLEDDIISRIIAQTCRQSGLSVIYQEILDYAGDEIYFAPQNGLAGKRFGEALFCFEDSSLIGLQKKGEQPKLNPPMDTLIEKDDRIICISRDENSIRTVESCESKAVKSGSEEVTVTEREPEKTLILGINTRTPMIIRQLENYVAPGSRVMVVSLDPNASEVVNEQCDNLKNQTIEYTFGDVTNRRLLDRLKVETYDHAVLLVNMDLTPQQADSRLLITLLHLRDIAAKKGKKLTIVSEMTDPNNCRLASVIRADDFIVGAQLVSFLLTQISENKLLNGVYAEIFDADGAEIYLKPISDYVKPGKKINFYTLLKAAEEKGEVAIGYRRHEFIEDEEKIFGIVLNPEKSKTFTPEEQDRIIVVADD